MHYADLHAHSDYSDGARTPAEVVTLGGGAGLPAMALSDHDSVSGVAEARRAAERIGIELVAGVEISAGDEPEKDRFDLHILGLFIDETNPCLTAFLDYQADQRRRQKVQQMARFRELGFEIDDDDMLGAVKGVPGKPHLVAALLRRNPDRGVSEREFYTRYLGYGGIAHVPREDEPTADEAIEAIHAAGGVALLAHPLFYEKVSDLAAMIRGLVDAGLDGVEVDCPYELNYRFSDVAGGRAEIVREIGALTESMGLLRSGGSDYHGQGKGGPLGSAGVTRELFDALRSASGRR